MKLLLLATDDLDKTVTVAVDGVRYEYWVRGNYPGVLREFRRLLRLGFDGKALNILKNQSTRYDKL